MADIVINGITYPEPKRVAFPGSDGKPVVFDLPEDAEAALNPTSKRPVQNKVIYNAIAEEAGRRAGEDADIRRQMTSPFNFKGSCTYANLPASGNTVNDTWYLTDREYRVSWNGTGWAQSSFDESDYTDQLAACFKYKGNMKTLTITSFGACTDIGYYIFPQDYLDSIIDKPDGLTSAGQVITLPGDAVRQVIISVNAVYFRASLNGDWKHELDNAITFAGRLTDTSAIKTFAAAATPNTYYAVQGTFKTDDCIDWPENLSAQSGTLFTLYAQTLSATTLRQYFVTPIGIYIRAYRADTVAWNPWGKMEDGSDIPDYWTAPIRTAVDEINNQGAVEIDGTAYAVDSGMHGDRFAFLTDTHWSYGAMRTPQIVHEIMRSSGEMKIFHGGDIVDGSLSNTPHAEGETPSGEAIMSRAMYYKRLLSRTKRDIEAYHPIYYTIGNHEYMNPDQTTWAIPYQFTADEAYRFTVAGRNENIPAHSSVGDYYIDNAGNKIRYFFLSCGADYYIQGETKAWLRAQLAEMPGDYAAVIISHVALSESGQLMWTAGVSNSTPEEKAEGRVGLADVLDEAKAAGKNIAFMLSGHIHRDRDARTNGGILVVSTATDAWKKTRVMEIDPVTQKEVPTEQTKTGCNEMVPGTATEHCFDIVSFDLETRVLVMTRVGAGTSRAFRF